MTPIESFCIHRMLSQYPVAIPSDSKIRILTSSFEMVGTCRGQSPTDSTMGI